MENLVISKFGGSAVGVDGVLIPTIIKRINELKKDSKVITVFSAPLTIYNGKQRSLTDTALEIGRMTEKGENVSKEAVQSAISLSEEKYCSVGGMLKNAVKITSSYEILKE